MIVTVGGETTVGHLIFITLIFVVKSKSLDRAWLFSTPWTVQSKQFSRPE